VNVFFKRAVRRDGAKNLEGESFYDFKVFYDFKGGSLSCDNRFNKKFQYYRTY
jgi:hypothetical protein